MRGFGVLIDFVNFVFFIGLIVFFILYIIVGDRVGIFSQIAKMLIPVSYFFGMFILALKSDQDKYEKFRKEDKLDEIIVYLDRVDSIKDIIVIIIMCVVIIFLGMIEGLGAVDFLQAASSFVYMYLWHLLIFRKKEDQGNIQYMTNFDKIKDRIAIFFLPLLIMGVAMASGPTLVSDMFQAGAALLIMLSWRKLMIKS